MAQSLTQQLALRSRLTITRRMGAGLSVLAFVLLIVLADPSLIVNGLLLGMVLALGAIGLTLVYGILGFANIAHGDMMTLGAYVSLFLLTVGLPGLGLEGAGLGPFTFGYPLLIALPITMLAIAAIAIGLEVGVYRRLRGRGVNMVVLAMASLGVALAIRAIVQILWGTQPQHYPRISKAFYRLPFDIRIPPDNLFLAGVAIFLVVGTYLFLTRTRIGKAMRATADNPELARVCGINTGHIFLWTWVLAAAYAATAGTLFAVSQAQLLPILGWKVLIPLFAAVILGGIGNVYGALVGGIVVGLSMEVSTDWISPAYKPAIAFAIMLAVLTFRPRGILGQRS